MDLKVYDWVELRCAQRDDDEHGVARFTPAGAQCRVEQIQVVSDAVRQFHVICPANGMWVVIDDGSEADRNLIPIRDIGRIVRLNAQQESGSTADAKEFALSLLVDRLSEIFDHGAHPDGAEEGPNASLWISGQLGLAPYDFARRVLGLSPKFPPGIG